MYFYVIHAYFRVPIFTSYILERTRTLLTKRIIKNQRNLDSIVMNIEHELILMKLKEFLEVGWITSLWFS